MIQFGPCYVSTCPSDLKTLVLIWQDQDGKEEDLADLDLRGVPDADKLKEVLGATESEAAFGFVHSPSRYTNGNQYIETVSCVFAQCGPDLSAKNLFDAIWRLCMFLRHWGGGCDRHWIKNPAACRKVSTQTSWWKHLGYKMSVVFFCFFDVF